MRIIIIIIISNDFLKMLWGKFGKIIFSFYSDFGNCSVSDIQTNITIIIKNINEMEKKFYEILNNIEKDLNEKGENYNIIILKLFI